jgi:hypothetical protein
MDDEFFVHIVSLSHDPDQFPGDQTIPRIRRKAESGKPALLHGIASRARAQHIDPPEGQRVATMVVTGPEDKVRLRRVLRRYTAGIFFHETDSRLDLSSIRIERLPQLVISSETTRQRVVKFPLWPYLMEAAEKQIGTGIFSYRLLRADPAGALYLAFFEVNEFLAFWGLKDTLTQERP